MYDAYATIASFLSTPSGWRATAIFIKIGWPKIFLSTPSGWRATHSTAGGGIRSKFLSTPSGWRATAKAHKIIGTFCDNTMKKNEY